MSGQYRVFLIGFRSGAAMENIERYLEAELGFTDAIALKKLLYDTPSMIAENCDEKQAQKLRTDLENIGARIQLKVFQTSPSSPTVMEIEKLPESDAPKDYGKLSAENYQRLMEAGIFMVPQNDRRGGKKWMRYLLWGVSAALAALFITEVIILLRYKPSEAPRQLEPIVIKVGSEDGSGPGDQAIELRPITNTMPVRSSSSDELSEAVELIESGSYAEAINNLKQWTAEHPGDKKAADLLAFTYTMMARKAFQENDLGAAIDYIEKANEASGGNPDIQAQLGALYYAQKDYGRALDHLEQALANGSTDPEVHLLLAYIYYYFRDDMEKAEEHLTEVIKAEPGRKDIIEFRNKIRLERGHEESMDEASGIHFTVKYEGIEDRDAGYTVMYELERAYNSIGYDLGEYPPDPITVILYTQQQFQDILNAPPWAGGAYDGRIRLPIGGLPDRDDDNLRRLLYHEYTHAVIHRLTGGNCPIWLNEGLAQIMQERSGASRDPWIKVEILRRGAIPTLNALSQPFIRLSQEQAVIAYVESYYATQYFIQTYGMTGVRSLLKELASGTEFKKAFYDRLGTEFPVFEERFYNRLKTIIE